MLCKLLLLSITLLIIIIVINNIIIVRMRYYDMNNGVGLTGTGSPDGVGTSYKTEAAD